MLTDDEIARYARQIVIPGIGASGQEKLLASTVLVVGCARGIAQASLYLAASGVRVVADVDEAFDAAIVAEVSSLEAGARTRLLESTRPLFWYVADEDGFRSGMHPAAPLPAAARDCSEEWSDAPWNDAAACDVAALACAHLVGLRFDAREQRVPSRRAGSDRTAR